MKSLPAKIVKPLSVAASIASMMGLVSCFSFYGSKREAVAAKDNYIMNEGTYSHTYKEWVKFDEKYPNPNYQREYDFWEHAKKLGVKRETERRLSSIEACERSRHHLADIYLGNWHNSAGIRDVRAEYPSIKYVRIDDEKNYKECLSDAERTWMRLGVERWNKKEPKKFLTRLATKQVVKTKWIDIVTCIEELNPRQFVCWDRRSDKNYRYFRW